MVVRDERPRPPPDVPRRPRRGARRRVADAARPTATSSARRSILVAGLDAEQEVPILHLRIRKAARRGAKVFVIHPRRTRLRDVAEHLLVPARAPDVRARADPRRRRGEGTRSRAASRAALREAGGEAVVLAGRAPRRAPAGRRRRADGRPAGTARGSRSCRAARATAAPCAPASTRRCCPAAAAWPIDDRARRGRGRRGAQLPRRSPDARRQADPRGRARTARSTSCS